MGVQEKLGDTIGEVLAKYFKRDCSLLEFGSNDCATYFTFRPRRYYGVDRTPKMYLDVENAKVDKADVRTWKPPLEHFDLVVCDAHGAMDDPELYDVTYSQVTLAQLWGDTVLVDDCWLNDVARPALLHLGTPSLITIDRPGLWIWQKNA